MSNKKTVLTESQVRRWGKLAAIGKPLTENWLDTLIEEEEEGEEEMAMDAEEAPADEMAMDAEEAPAGDMEDKVEDIVAAVVDAIADVTDVDISMDADAEAPEAEDAEGDDEAEPAMREPAMREPAMREPAMRDEEDEPGMRDKKYMEGLELDVIDDEELTEAVLKRVVERLLKRSK
jgi:hypothetical protein